MAEPTVEADRVELEVTTEAAIDFLRSDKFGDEFIAKTLEQRRSLISALNEILSTARNRNKHLAETERAAVKNPHGLAIDRKQIGQHPEREIARVFRRGKYLDLVGIEPSKFEAAGYTSGADLLRLYEEHIKRFGEKSVAHLCLNPILFKDLTRGIYLSSWRPDRNKDPVVANTIDEARGVLERLDSDENLRLYRADLSYRHTKSGAIRKIYFVMQLKEGLVAWDAIPEEPQTQVPQ